MNSPHRPPRGFDPRDLISFLNAREAVDGLETALRAHGIVIAPGSALEATALIIRELDDWRRGQTPSELADDIRIELRRAAGLLELVKLVNSTYERTGTLAPFVPHLYLLNEAREVAQNVRRVADAATNKLFELFMGCICAACGSDLVLDHPHHSQGGNPDILVTIRARRWGFACKVIEGQSPRTWFERFSEGVAQVHSSEAEVGCVVFNLKNLIDHDALWPILNEEEYRAGREEPMFGAWRNVNSLLAYLRACAVLRAREFGEMTNVEEVRHLLGSKKVIPGVLFFLPTAAWVVSESGPLLTAVHVFCLAPLGRVSPSDGRVLELLNEALHHRQPTRRLLRCRFTERLCALFRRHA